MSDEIDPLDPELESFLAAERSRPEPSEAARHAALARVLASSGAAPVVAGVSRGTAIGLAVGGLVIGVVIGVLAHMWLAPVAPPRVSYVDRPAPRTTPPQPLPQAPDVTPPPPVAPVIEPEPERPRVAVRDAGTRDHGGSLREELALIARAQTALQRGLPQNALDAVDEHARRFPHGDMVEEREALAVQALARAHRLDAARSRAQRFEARYPRSMLIPAIRAALEDAP